MRNVLKHCYPLLLLTALLLNATVPFFAVNNFSSAQIQQAPAGFGDRILICTGNSFKWVKLADLRSGKEKPQNHSGIKCPHCNAVRDVANALPDILARGSYSRIAHEQVRLVYSAPIHDFHLTPTHHVRAPPLSFIA